MYVCAIACDVGGKQTHIISNVPDTHCACRLCMRNDPPISSSSGCLSRPHPWTWSEMVTTLKNEEKITENKDLVPKRKAMSVIWNYFGDKKDDFDQTRVLHRQ